MMKGVLLFSLLSLSVAVAACSSGDSGSSNSSSPSAASTERIVYLADQDIDGVFELYLVGSSIKLNPPLSQGKNVLGFQITPDKTAVVYRADQDTDDVFELYRVEFANPGVSTKLNSPLPVGGDVWSAVMTPDSSSVLYVADQTTDGVSELYRVPFATPGVSTKLNGPLVPGGNVFFDIGTTPDNSAVYRATEDTANTIELYRVPLATPGLSTKLNGALPPNADAGVFKITPNGTVVVYTVSHRIPSSDPSRPSGFDFLEELDSVAFATPGQSMKLSGRPVVPGGGGLGPDVFVGQYDITPDSSSVVYVLTGSSFDFRLLYRVPFATPGQSTRLTPIIIESFAIRPDSSGVVFESKVQSFLQSTELYIVPFATPGVSTQLYGPLVAGGRRQDFGNTPAFAIAPDNSSVVYIDDETLNGAYEIYRVSFATPGVRTKLNGPLVAGGMVDSGTLNGRFQGSAPVITPDSSAVLYRASQTTAGMFELYRVPFATPTVSTKLNGPLTSGGDVKEVLVQ